MELFNELPEEREQEIEDFLTFIPIYESLRRTKSLESFLKRNQKLIKGRTCMEAGAGKGMFSKKMAELGASKVFSVERSGVLFSHLEKETAEIPEIVPVREDICDFSPGEKIDLLFHELYGPLVLDETILALQFLKIKPQHILPDGGRLWAMPLSLAQIAEADPYFDPEWKNELEGALVSDLVNGIPFQPKWTVFDWNVHSEEACFEFQLPEKCDFLALCGEITHEGKKVLNMWWTYNWPVIYTPVCGSRFEIEFIYNGDYTEVFFNWLK